MAPRELTDDEVFGGVPGMVWTEAQRQGVDPSLALRVARQESAFNTSAVSPKGARGVMQLMPGTARDLGVDPNDPAQNIEGGVRYLKQQIDAFGSPDLALAAYNAGPGAVRKYGGVPPYAETQDYVQRINGGGEVRELSDEEVFGGSAPREAAVTVEVPGRPELGVGRAYAPPRKAAAPVRAQAPNPTVAQDALSGFVQPFQDLGATVARRMDNPRQAPTSVGDFLKGAFIDPVTDSAELLGGVVNLASAPVQAAVRPIARGINRVAPPMYETGPSILSPEFWDDKADIPRRLDANARQAAIEGTINTALSAAKPAVPRATPAPKAQPKSLDQLRADKDAAYRAVDTSGFTFKQADLQTLARSAAQIVEDAGGPDLNEQATKLAARIQSLADRGDLTLTQLDKLRGQIGEKVIAKGEPTVGYELQRLVDGLIDSAQVPEMRKARAANMRFKKVEEVTNRLESADLVQSTSGNGGNQNAPRQKLRPLIDPKSPQRMRNLTPDEQKALRKVVKGTAGQNTLRALSAFDPTAGKLQAMLQGVAAFPSAGLSLATIPVGIGARLGEAAIANRNVQGLLDLMSSGGGAPKTAPRLPVLQLAGKPPVKLLSPAGVVGASTVVAPVGRIPSSQGQKAPAQKGPPRKRQAQR